MEKEFENEKELHQFLGENTSSFDELQKVSAFFVFNSITFSGTTKAGGFSESSIQRLELLMLSKIPK